MPRIKLFHVYIGNIDSKVDCEKSVNNFLKKITEEDLIDVKITTSVGDCVDIMVVYRT